MGLDVEVEVEADVAVEEANVVDGRGVGRAEPVPREGRRKLARAALSLERLRAVSAYPSRREGMLRLSLLELGSDGGSGEAAGGSGVGSGSEVVEGTEEEGCDGSRVGAETLRGLGASLSTSIAELDASALGG